MAKLRLGVIGAGSWAVASHLPNLQRHSDKIEFVIVNRPDVSPLQKIQQQFGFSHATTNWQDVVAAELDIIVISSPPAYHYEQAKAALISGAHVLCEKPFTLAAKDAWDLASIVRRTSRSLFVAFGWNYRPMVVEAYRLMQDCALGEIEHVMLHGILDARIVARDGGLRRCASEFCSAGFHVVSRCDFWRRVWASPTLSHFRGSALVDRSAGP